MSAYPLARSEGIIAEAVGDELLIYVEATQIAHALSPDAASIWRLCDGETSAKDIARELGLEQHRVEQALDELAGVGLIEEPQGISRRALHKRAAVLGAAALSAPLIKSVAIPPASAALSFTCASLALSKTSGDGSFVPQVSCPAPFARCWFLGFGQVGSAAATLTLTNNGGPSGPVAVAVTSTQGGFALANNGCNLAGGLASGASCTFGVNWSEPADCSAFSGRFADFTVSATGVACLRLRVTATCPVP